MKAGPFSLIACMPHFGADQADHADHADRALQATRNAAFGESWSMLSRIQWLMDVMYQVIINSSSICSPPFLIHVSTSSNIKELSPTFISRMVSWNNLCIFHSDVFENLPPLLEKHPGIMWPPSYLQILTPAMVTSGGHTWSLIAAREATTPIFSDFNDQGAIR